MNIKKLIELTQPKPKNRIQKTVIEAKKIYLEILINKKVPISKGNN